MQISKVVSGDSHEISVQGHIDGAGANQLEIEVLAAMKAGAKEIFINLSQTTSLCSAGIRVLLQYYRQMKNSQKALLVTRPSEAVETILEMTGFRDLIVESDRPKA
jgi:anti-anti-sigma factor